MTKREIELEIKLVKDQLTLTQLYREDFVKELGIRGLEDFVNGRLERLKTLINLHKNFNNAEN